MQNFIVYVQYVILFQYFKSKTIITYVPDSQAMFPDDFELPDVAKAKSAVATIISELIDKMESAKSIRRH